MLKFGPIHVSDAVHVLVDNSNTYKGAQVVSSTVRDTTVRLWVRGLVDSIKTVAKTQEFAWATITGPFGHSKPLRGLWTTCGFQIDDTTTKKDAATPGSQTRTHLKSLLTCEEPGTFVLVSGKGGEVYRGMSTIRFACELISKGWNFHVLAWKSSLHWELATLKNVCITYLDAVRSLVTYTASQDTPGGVVGGGDSTIIIIPDEDTTRRRATVVEKKEEEEEEEEDALGKSLFKHFSRGSETSFTTTFCWVHPFS